MKKFILPIILAIITAGCVQTGSLKKQERNTIMFSPNNFAGTDSARISAAVSAAAAAGINTVTIPERQAPDGRKFWLIDEAITLPANMEVIIDNCKIKLSDACRDNFFRSANCGIGITKIIPIENIRIIGKGNAVLEGADHPRASGDSGKVLNQITYGTDAGKINENQKGDWRNIGILLAHVKNFAISNITIRNYHCWGISMEYCSYGKLNNITFDTNEYRIIDGKQWRILNQDGIDLRRGCNNIKIENISGTSGDDIIAITALKTSRKTTGTAVGTEISIMDENMENNHVHDITIRNVRGASNHNFIRLLNNFGIKIYNVSIENVANPTTTPIGNTTAATIRIGDANPNWGGATPLGDLYNISIKNVESYAPKAIYIAGSLAESELINITNFNPACKAIECPGGAEKMRNVKTINIKNNF